LEKQNSATAICYGLVDLLDNKLFNAISCTCVHVYVPFCVMDLLPAAFDFL